MSSARVCIVAAFGLLAVGGPAWADRESAIAPIDWKHVVTSTDMDRIKGWRTAFIKALENAKARGNAAISLSRNQAWDQIAGDAGLFRLSGIRLHCGR